MQNELSVTSPMGMSLPRLERCRAQVLLSHIHDAAIPTPVPRTLFQRPEMQNGCTLTEDSCCHVKSKNHGISWKVR